MRFWLGTHLPAWISRVEQPLFVSHRRLVGRKTLPVPVGPIAIDSGAFSELNEFGEWRTSETAYVDAVARYAAELKIEWAAPMDWMCEPFVIEKTGLSVVEHQHRTVDNFVRLREQSDIFIPVLQGYEMDDYFACLEMYDDAGVDLRSLPLVGIGSVCRRENTTEIDEIVTKLAAEGLALHGFGVKIRGLAKYGQGLASADSMAWSYAARKRPRLPGCEGHQHCNNCERFALLWRWSLIENSNRNGLEIT